MANATDPSLVVIGPDRFKELNGSQQAFVQLNNIVKALDKTWVEIILADLENHDAESTRKAYREAAQLIGIQLDLITEKGR